MSFPDTFFNMVRSDMLAIPQQPLPPGYHLRTYQEGDGERWLALQKVTEPTIPITADFFLRQFGDHLAALPGRFFLVETDDGVVAATITAWWEHERPTSSDRRCNGRGRIHWVAVHPAFQRRGLTKPMMTHAMNRLAQEHERAMLGTSSDRIWAVKVYLDYGFRPDPAELADPAVQAAWDQVQSILRHPGLADQAAAPQLQP